MKYFDGEFREIVTKAVCGKGKEYIESKHTVEARNKPDSILGCWVINHVYKAKKKKDHVEISGSYEVNIWYSFNDNTKTEVITERVHYEEDIELKEKDDTCISDDLEVIVKVIQQPNCLGCHIHQKGNKIEVEVEKEFLVNVIGETKLSVKISKDDHDFYREDRHHD
ncbi:outer spore coat protein CotE [Salimicrobium halophilum]|uniref:Spore coat protein E n=1 Tax=Salimicrobium halophilum TaxID=86666 RepID=A0A1G8Q6S8_9BACI|nr:outer spore coat protein CotE [Salimicrobium halophilum]SDJ00411.1 spore coat protein E [Salimicrobium halophilum]